MKPRTVIDLLARLSEADLIVMRETTRRDLARARAEVLRLKIEYDQLEEAAAQRESTAKRALA